MPETVANNEVTEQKCDPSKEISKIHSEKSEVTPEKTTDESVAATGGSIKDNSDAAPAPTYDLNKFQLQRILNNNTRNKSISLLGSFPHVSENDNAIVLLEKKAFREKDVATKTTEEGAENLNASQNGSVSEENLSYFGNDLQVKTEFINNIYGSYQCIPPMKLSGIKATVVYPATDKHIEKYSINQKYIINETPEFYKDITLPYITSSQMSLEWVYNILEHKQESERIIYEDPDAEQGFIILPDLKWDGRNLENLYVLVITHKHNIKSIRDLNASHLPLLKNIRKRSIEELERRYGLVGTQLRMYFHYQPSFYHLHVHINPVRNDAPGIWCEKSHMLDTVINNLELLPDYYERATLPFVVYEGNKLLELYEEKMPIRGKKEEAVKAEKVSKREADHLDDENKCKKLKIDNDEEPNKRAVTE